MNNQQLQAEAQRIGLTHLMEIDRDAVASKVHHDATEEDIDRIAALLQASIISFAVNYKEN